MVVDGDRRPPESENMEVELGLSLTFGTTPRHTNASNYIVCFGNSSDPPEVQGDVSRSFVNCSVVNHTQRSGLIFYLSSSIHNFRA